MNIDREIIALQTQLNALKSGLSVLQAELKGLQDCKNAECNVVPQAETLTGLASHVGSFTTNLPEGSARIDSPTNKAADTAESVLRTRLSEPYAAAGIGVGVDHQDEAGQELGRWIIKIGISSDGTFYCAGIGPA